ncbi:RHS repeat-associated core domain-containing protein [uncultured Clostridium sp.]|uniref:RHS repeat-associated core domain-containing protein n=1 Tax=uncultured Clostridium sp. TaxID=59620 RepID=UPI0025FC75D0|nr:RHS repeat-associated core domain-containing protein [uncultured Clostridium sp.]
MSNSPTNSNLTVRYYYSVDEQGSTDFITDSTGKVKNQYYYDAFGKVLDRKEEVHNRITYTGQQFDNTTQQYYLRARFYNPVIGRFTQEDIYRGDGLNLYAYCGNNPVEYYDPSGYKVAACAPKKRQINSDELRNSPGITTQNNKIKSKQSKLMYQNGDIGVIPQEIKDRLNNRRFNNFDELRAALWKEIGNSEYATEFRKSGQTLMKGGRAPFSSSGRYSIHHKQPIAKGGGVYDLDNLIIVSPKMHKIILDPKYHFGKKG